MSPDDVDNQNQYQNSEVPEAADIWSWASNKICSKQRGVCRHMNIWEDALTSACGSFQMRSNSSQLTTVVSSRKK